MSTADWRFSLRICALMPLGASAKMAKRTYLTEFIRVFTEWRAAQSAYDTTCGIEPVLVVSAQITRRQFFCMDTLSARRFRFTVRDRSPLDARSKILAESALLSCSAVMTARTPPEMFQNM